MKFKVYKNKKQLKNEELYFNDQKIIFIFHYKIIQEKKLKPE